MTDILWHMSYRDNNKVFILQMKQKQKLEMRCPLSILSQLLQCFRMIAVMKNKKSNYFLLLCYFCWWACGVVFSVSGIKQEGMIPEWLSGFSNVTSQQGRLQLPDECEWECDFFIYVIGLVKDRQLVNCVPCLSPKACWDGLQLSVTVCRIRLYWKTMSMDCIN